MRFVPSVHQWPTIHRINADEHTEEIRALRNLKHTGLTSRAFRFDAHLAGPSEDLSRNQKRKGPCNNAVPRNIAPHEVIIVAAVTVAQKVRVVFVKSDTL